MSAGPMMQGPDNQPNMDRGPSNDSIVTGPVGDLAELIRSRLAMRRDIDKQAAVRASVHERIILPDTPLAMTDDELIDHVRKSKDMKNWYARHRSSMDTMFGQHGPLMSVALAITSKRNRPINNVQAAIHALHNIRHGLSLSDGLLKLHEPSLRNLRDGILRGDSPRKLALAATGPKISQYARALAGDHSATPIDMHVASLLWGRPDVSDREHRQGREHIMRLASKIGWTPRQVQASMWAANQRRNGETPTTYEDHFSNPEIADLAKQVMSSDKPLPRYQPKESTEPSDLQDTGHDDLLSHLVLSDDPAMDLPTDPKFILAGSMNDNGIPEQGSPNLVDRDMPTTPN